MKETPDYIRDAFEKAAKRTHRIAALMYCIRTIRKELSDELNRGLVPKPINEALSVVELALYERETRAWRDYLRWSLGVTEADRKKVRQAAYDRSLREGISIMDQLEEDGKYPGSWSSEVEKAFRKQIKIAFDYGQP